MYNPSRGGVRGGADQFTWESVKTDKHRENYLGHSLKAPVGRWQKGKDLSWYAKDRKNEESGNKTEQSEMAAIKRAEEEAMMIALGHKVVRKESLPVLSKEEMTEALKRNIGERDDQNIERIDGVGASSKRAALLTGITKSSQTKNEGVEFIANTERKSKDRDAEKLSHHRSKEKKKLKKRKKEKKTKHSSDDSYSEGDSPRGKQKKLKSSHDSHGNRSSSPENPYYNTKVKTKDKKRSKKSKKAKHNSDDSDSEDSSRKKHKKFKHDHGSHKNRSSSMERKPKDQYYRTKY